MIRDSILRAPHRSSALVLLFASILLAGPNQARADGDLVAKRGVVRHAVMPRAANPSMDPGGDIVVLDPTRPVERRRRIPEEVAPAAAPMAPVAAPTSRSAWAEALLGAWVRYVIR